ncbi:MAG: ribonuclease H-like domain-containing protein [Pirellulales bacterium]
MAEIAFDIETGPLPLEVIQAMPAFAFNSASVPHPGEFDPAKVRVGNLKDQSKIEEKIEGARVSHQSAVENYAQTLQAAADNHWRSIIDAAALSALTGEVLAIGYLGAKEIIDHQGKFSEKQILTRFWSQFLTCRNSGRSLVGWNIESFDLPFICQRSALLGVTVPDKVFTETGYVSFQFIDLMKRWMRPNRQAGVKLDTVARAMGFDGKPEGITGKFFYELFQTDRESALSYLSNDLRMVVQVGSRLGVSFNDE